MASASLTPRTVNMLPRLAPSSGSLTGKAPVARIRFSYETLEPFESCTLEDAKSSLVASWQTKTNQPRPPLRPLARLDSRSGTTTYSAEDKVDLLLLVELWFAEGKLLRVAQERLGDLGPVDRVMRLARDDLDRAREAFLAERLDRERRAGAAADDEDVGVRRVGRDVDLGGGRLAGLGHGVGVGVDEDRRSIRLDLFGEVLRVVKCERDGQGRKE